MKRITGMATHKARQKHVKTTLETLVNQFDHIYVYQNDFSEEYEYDNVTAIHTGKDLGCTGKFWAVNQHPGDYFFGVDDDILYPPNYVDWSVRNLDLFGKTVFGTYHGRVLNADAKDYFKDSKSYVFHDRVNINQKVEFGGAGVSVFIPERIGFEVSALEEVKNVDDVLVGLWAKDNGVPIIVFRHPENWIKKNPEIDYSTSIFEQSKKDSKWISDLALKIKE